MNFSYYDTPTSRYEFERNLYILREQIINKKIQFASDLKSTNDLIKVRLLPNKRIDLLTISENVRLEANMANMFTSMNSFPDIEESDDIL